MTILDATVPVLCDNACYSIIDLPTFIDGMEVIQIEEDLEKEGWIIINGRHYCCKECASEAEDGKS